MATFICIHGAWQAGWCWDLIAPPLRALGHSVLTPDLPGHGDDRTRRESVSLPMYVDLVVETVRQQPRDVILVGHSIAPQFCFAAGCVERRVKAVVCVAGVVADGRTPLDVIGTADPDYLAQITWAADGATATITPDGARRYLYPLCPVDRVERAIARLTPEPTAPFQTRVSLDRPTLARVRSYYVECARDRLILPAMQREMQSVIGAPRVFRIEADHSPFLSAPEELVSILGTVAECEASL
ncbi:MAG TPA: alpha/beta fold hydrolase [Vicinamibacterales bacterium]|jgi:pimeloyl-ACP methyl ester carboxylesterase|nr:alpha/beta fold hydrolase [Vicinamibacterales bacterium]